MILLVQVGVLALTVLLWWRVQRDLSGRASAPPLAEWERLRQTVEQLTADLERRAVVAEQRVAAAEASLAALLEARGEVGPPARKETHLAASPHSSASRVPPAMGRLGGDSPTSLPPSMSASAEREALTPEGVERAAGPGVGSSGPGAASSPDRFAHAEQLIAAGAADAVDIARQSGVSRGEAELLLSLRARRV